ncbi:MAG: SH3-like domain-containing protein [Lentimicrobium sp.]|jgi:hypothetical protein|nr:SH3-like domain-containing protein [Lentimicrobium sp.]MDD2527491.1 GW dipeptide domain-containing protein [Lentimicrobiaceae bacterium]MDD4597010.1 GW dipeptide domain-containing protein [Lentimicrobiaceae bacterium]MDY0024829.1 GW dipeptide domain-containing protein [Lentimicrobium sp.]
MKKTVLNLSLLFIIGSIVLLLFSCNRSASSDKSVKDLPPGTHAVSVIEVLQTRSYTYLQVLENNNKYWIAVALREAKPGDVLYFTDALEMKDFESKDLNRTFPLIYFVQDPSDSPNPQERMTTGRKRLGKISDISVETAVGGITLETLFQDRKKYENSTIKVRGIVVKVNNNIMGKNWIHLQDGTGFDDQFDLTITTNDQAKPGDTITAEGTLLLNKDFGSGYYYDILIENATISDIQVPSTETKL